jgi:transcriptional regulator with XRE-family HTH domain
MYAFIRFMPHSAYMSNSLRQSLKQKMKERGWTQSSLSERSGISQPQISRMLSGETKRISKAVKTLCRYASLPIPEPLLTRDQEGIIQQEVQNLLIGSPQKIDAIIALLRAASDLATKPGAPSRRRKESVG